MTVTGLWTMLVKEGQTLMSNAFAPGTLVNLQYQWRRFFEFCDLVCLNSCLTVQTEVLIAYIASCSDVENRVHFFNVTSSKIEGQKQGLENGVQIHFSVWLDHSSENDKTGNLKNRDNGNEVKQLGKNYFNGLKVLHVLKGAQVANFEEVAVRLVLRGVARILYHTPKQAQAK